ncbi:MAG: hypothetical protein AB1752_00600 [Candidatus Zixiibacteriota bacterium]
MRKCLGFCMVGALLVAGLGRPCLAVNLVEVESKTVTVGEMTSVGVFVTNDVVVTGWEIPLVVRTISGGAYMTAFTPGYPPSRLSGLLDDISSLTTYPTPDGTCKPGGFGAIGTLDYTSPDAMKSDRLGIFSNKYLPAGSDGSPGTGTPSMSLALTANANVGSFEIDTTCVNPGQHLLFAHTSGAVVPNFVKGTITVAPPPPPAGDMDCDGDTDAVDLAILIDIVFFGAAPIPVCGS